MATNFYLLSNTVKLFGKKVIERFSSISYAKHTNSFTHSLILCLTLRSDRKLKILSLIDMATETVAVELFSKNPTFCKMTSFIRNQILFA